jgi:hypothetical protein
MKTIIYEYIYPFLFLQIAYLRGVTDPYTAHHKPVAKVEIFSCFSPHGYCLTCLLKATKAL